MRSAVLIPAIITYFLLTLSLYAEDSTGETKNTPVEKTVSVDEKKSADSASGDIRDTDVRDLEEQKPQKKAVSTVKKKAVKKTEQKPAGKKSAKKENKTKKKTADKTGSLKKSENGKAVKPGKGQQKKKDKEKSDAHLFSLRDLVINNRIFDVRVLLNDPERRALYDLDGIITLTDGRKTILLNDAVSLNFIDMADILLGAGAGINNISPDSGAALHVAAAADNTAMIRYLLQKGADVNVKDSQGNTPLHYALHLGHFESANLLVMKGADTAAVNTAGSTTIIEAVTGANMDCIKLILAQNRHDVNRADSKGVTPIYIAMKRNDTVLMRLLRDNGALDKRVTVADITFGELIEGTYSVKEYGRVQPGTRRSADDTTAPFKYVFFRDGTGTIDMDDSTLTDRKLRWHVEGSALILEELDASGYVSKRLRFMFLQTAGTVIFEKSDVQYGDVNAARWEIIKSVPR